MSDVSILIYAHDPMCSWCWGFRPTLQALRNQLPKQIRFQHLLGGLAADSDQAMPIEMQQSLQNTWRSIQQKIPGTEFNFAFWQQCQPRRSTYPACRAVLAARTLQADCEEAMILAIQTAYYTRAMNPSNADTLQQLASEIGLDSDDFLQTLHREETEQQLQQEIQHARQIGMNSFPSLVLQTPDQHYWPIAVHYTDAKPMLKTIESYG